MLHHLQVVAVVEMQDDLEVWVVLDGGHHQVAQVDQVGVAQRATRSLDDYRRVRVTRSAHDGLDLFHVVDVEGANAVAAAFGLVQDESQGDERHGGVPRCRLT